MMRRKIRRTEENDKLRLLIQLSDTPTMELGFIGTMITENHNSVSAKLEFTPGDQGTMMDFYFEFEKLKNNIEDTKMVEAVLTYMGLKAYYK
ncbi:hypothetical protein Bca4012_006581 [Brassica carinata]